MWPQHGSRGFLLGRGSASLGEVMGAVESGQSAGDGIEVKRGGHDRRAESARLSLLGLTGMQRGSAFLDLLQSLWWLFLFTFLSRASDGSSASSRSREYDVMASNKQLSKSSGAEARLNNECPSILEQHSINHVVPIHYTAHLRKHTDNHGLSLHNLEPPTPSLLLCSALL